MNLDYLPLHLPIKSMNDLDHKYYLLDHPISASAEIGNIYNLKDLISPVALLRHASSLLNLYPLIDFDRNEWESGPQGIIDSFFSDIQKARSVYLLKNALQMTQSSIAQEALLSGETLLKNIYKNKEEIFKYKDPCKEVNSESTAFSCSIYKNRLLTKNFIKYLLFNSSNVSRYKELLKSNDSSSEISTLLDDGSGLFTSKVINYENKYYLELNIGNGVSRLKLPDATELDGYEVSYSENMPKLLKLQGKLIDAIISVSPQIMKDGLPEKYSALILLNTFN